MNIAILRFSFYARNCNGDWGLWVRLWGYGFSISNSAPLFSERAGLRKVVRIKGIKFELLTPRK